MDYLSNEDIDKLLNEPITKKEYLSKEEVDRLLNEMAPTAKKAMEMGPIRRKLHHLVVSFGCFVYDQKTKFPYNVALKRGKPLEDILTSEEKQSLLEAMRPETVEHDHPSIMQAYKDYEAVRRGATEHDRVANTNENNGREM